MSEMVEDVRGALRRCEGDYPRRERHRRKGEKVLEDVRAVVEGARETFAG